MRCGITPWQGPGDALPEMSTSPRYQQGLMMCMPVQGAGLSALSMALLSTLLKRYGVATEECYFHFDFADIMGREDYRAKVDNGRYGRIGEMLFAEDLHGPIADEEALGQLADHFGGVDERHRKLAAFRDLCLERVGRVGADLIGFTANCHQLLPSLWLAREIKREWPRVRIVFGGSACSDPMGQAVWDAYPEEVDYVVSGYGEKPLLDLVFGRLTADREVVVNAQCVDLDSLPIPDYDPFLEQASGFMDKSTNMMLAFETSRGCWWGEKSHCTFCGLNQQEIAYVYKSTDRAVEEIRAIWERYGIHLFATDTILAQSHIKEVMPRLADFDSRPNIFYEVKSNMRLHDIKALREASVYWVQPGIESLSTALLKHIRKGVTAIQNVAFMKWCREEVITVTWNLLCAIPGEELADYEDQLRLMPLISHLDPPSGVSPIRVDRYSPYFNSPQEFGWAELRPMAEYRFLHPHLDDDELSRIAYFFDGVGGDLKPDAYFAELSSAQEEWQRRHKAGYGLFWDDANGLVRIDGSEASVFGRSATLDAVLDATHEVTSLSRLLKIPGVDEELVDQLVDHGILYREGQKMVNLAVRIPTELLASEAANAPALQQSA